MEKTYPKFTLPHAQGSLERICKERLIQLYGEAPPPQATARLEAELAMLQGTNHSSVYMLAHSLATHLHHLGHATVMQGTFGSALLAYLLQITEENPLPAHYRCPHCKFLRWTPKARSGYDLPHGICPRCGHSLIPDGQALPYETALGLAPGDCAPYLAMVTTTEGHAAAVSFLVQLLGTERVALACEWNRPVCFLLLPDGMAFEDVTVVTPLQPPVFGVEKQTTTPGYTLRNVLQKVLILDSQVHDTLATLHRLTHTDPAAIPYNSPLLLQAAQHFSDLVSTTDADQPFPHREDVFLTLQQFGVPRQTAFAATEAARRGKLDAPLAEKLRSLGVPEGYVDALQRCTYLPSKAHLISTVKLFMRLAWFRLYYPKECRLVGI